MITLNLLPPELRKRERTPLAVLLPLLAGLICVLSAGAVAAYVHFVWLSEVVNEREQLVAELNQKKPRLKYEENLLAEESEYKKRADTIKNIASGRILMTQRLDQIAEITTAGDSKSQESYLVWVKEMKYSPASNRGRKRIKGAAKSGGQISLKGLTLADQDPLLHFNWFHGALKSSDMFKIGFDEISDPVGTIEMFSEEIEPRKGWTMDLALQMKDPIESKKLREKAMKMREVATEESNSGAERDRRNK